MFNDKIYVITCDVFVFTDKITKDGIGN